MDGVLPGDLGTRIPESLALQLRRSGSRRHRRASVGDVGQSAREEIDYEPAGAGGRNYGWRHREGSIATPGVPPGPSGSARSSSRSSTTDADGVAVTGGFVYRGSALPDRYHGRYFFGDYGSGRVWSLGLAVDAETGEASFVDEIEHTDELGGTHPGLSSFARDRLVSSIVTTRRRHLPDRVR